MAAEQRTESDVHPAKLQQDPAGRGEITSDRPRIPSYVGPDGKPMLVPLDSIDEDPHQPRAPHNPGFAPESIAELAASFGPNGPKSPISLRVNPDNPERYIVNHGARRTRAARLRGLLTIPAFIDNDYSEVDQVIENLQRDSLTPREVADWIGRELARGVKNSDIARSIGKSAAFVSQHASLLNLPDVVAAAFNGGRTNDVTVVNELVTAFKKNPHEVAAWLADERREINRAEVRILREFLDQRHGATNRGAGNLVSQDDALSAPGPKVKSSPRTIDPRKLPRSIVQVDYGGRPARLLFSLRPSSVGHAWIKNEDDGTEHEVSLESVRLTAIIEG